MRFRKSNWPVGHATWQELLAFEDKLWRMYQKEKDVKKKAEIGLVAFIVSLLMRRPFRSRTLRTIKIGRNLLTQKTEDGKRRIFRLFPKENLKCGKEIVEMSVPKILEPKLEIFLKEIRPALVDRKTGNYLFPGLNGGVLSSAALYKLLRRWSLKIIEKPLTPKYFQHLYAMRKLKIDLYKVVSLIGVDSITTFKKIYRRFSQENTNN